MAKLKRTTRKPVARAAKPRPKKNTGRQTREESRRGTDRRRRDPETLRLRSDTLSLTVHDLDRSRRFYTDLLGFIVEEQWKDGGQVRGMSLKAGACSLGLSQDDWAKGRDRAKGEGVRIWCEMAQDIDALADASKKLAHTWRKR